MTTDTRAGATDDLFAQPMVTASQGPSGTIYLRSGHELPPPSRCLGDWLVRWAKDRPETVFLAERPQPGAPWRTLSYRDALERVSAVAAWLIHSDAGPDRPVAILSENAIDHAVLALAAMHVGIPVATISTAYSLQSSDHLKLKAMVEFLDPGVLYVSDTGIYEPALSAIDGLHRAQLLCSAAAEDSPFAATLLEKAIGSGTDDAVASAFTAVTPDTVARLLFTSGSTGTPKAVINTQRMLTSNQEANSVLWPFLMRSPPVIVDWLPWSHTFGCNFTSNMVLRFGGSLYIDDGKPAPPLIQRTVDNIKDVRPTMCFNVPRGYDMLLGELQRDADFRRIFFDMKLIFYAAAALPKVVWDRLLALSLETTGHAIPLVAAWGSTETAPLATDCHFQAETTGNIGVPIPGTELKLVPSGSKLEVRVKGPNITPGYYKFDAKTRESFDDEGYYIMGDAVRFADPERPEKGLFFDGRLSEDFKLTTGTWVSVGELRIAGIDALAPLAQDIVVTGHDRADVGFLVFPNPAACRTIAGVDDDAPLDRALTHPLVRAHVADGLKALKEAFGGSSRHARRARLLAAAPDPDTGEITDKAYLNQRQVLDNRAADVALLYGDDPADYVSVDDG